MLQHVIYYEIVTISLIFVQSAGSERQLCFCLLALKEIHMTYFFLIYTLIEYYNLVI